MTESERWNLPVKADGQELSGVAPDRRLIQDPFRTRRGRRPHDDDEIRLVEAAFHLFCKTLAGDEAIIPPDLADDRIDEGNDRLDPLLVRPRIADEDVCHGTPLVSGTGP